MTQLERPGLTRAIVYFAIVGGVLGEAFEVLVLERGGMSPPGLRLRLTLWAVYALTAGAIAAVAGMLFRAPTRRTMVAALVFGALLVLPWLNFDYLPQLLTARTLIGNAIALLVVIGLASAVARYPRSASLAVLLAAVAVNLSALRRPHAAPPVANVRAGAEPQTDVLLIVIDTLRADHLGTYGYPRPTSPHLDTLAASGTVFEQAVAQATYTKPSIASLLTGTYVHRHGVISSRDALGSHLPTLAEALHAQGYRTAAFSSNPWITPEFRFERGFDHFESNRAIDVQLSVLYRLLRRVGATLKRNGVPVDLTGWLLRASGETNPSNSRRDEILGDAVIGWLDENGDQPFFVYAHFIGPHDPYDPPAEWVKPFRDPSWNGTPSNTKPPGRVLSIFETASALDPVAREMLVAQYDGAVAFADRLVARITEDLARRNLLDRTLVIVTADHGEEFYEHGNWGHGVRLYDEIVRVPLIMRLPGVVPTARRSDVAMLIDVFPTILGLLGRSLDGANLNGRNLFAAAQAAPAAGFSEYFSVEGGSYVSRMVVQDGLKLIETHDGARGQRRVEAFDLTRDRAERHNLLAEGAPPASPEQLATLERLLAEFSRAAPAGQAPEVDVKGSTQEALRALGY